MPKEWAVPTDFQTGLSGVRYCWMKCRRNIQGGIPPINRNGACFFLEQMFHNAAAMWCKAHQRCSSIFTHVEQEDFMRDL